MSGRRRHATVVEGMHGARGMSTLQQVEHGDMRKVLVRLRDMSSKDKIKTKKCIECGNFLFSATEQNYDYRRKFCSAACKEKARKTAHPSSKLLPTDSTLELKDVSDLALGIAAEHIVCADLLMQGYRAYLTDQFCAYDVAVDLDGCLIRVQVKATRGLKGVVGRPYSVYNWTTRKTGKKGKRLYKHTDFDIWALVALDIKKVAYLAEKEAKLQIVNLRPPGDNESHGNRHYAPIDQNPFNAALKAFMS